MKTIGNIYKLIVHIMYNLSLYQGSNRSITLSVSLMYQFEKNIVFIIKCHETQSTFMKQEPWEKTFQKGQIEMVHASSL